MVKEDRLTSVARGVALFVGVFALLNVVARVRNPGFDANEWWLDFRPMPGWVGGVAVGAIAGLMLAWAVRPGVRGWRRVGTVAVLAVAVGVALVNGVTFYRVRGAGLIRTPVPVPFSGVVLLVLAFVVWRVLRGRAGRLRVAYGGAAFVVCAVGFPLAQVVQFGMTDYRRPAGAIVVLGARAFPNGRASDALEDRVLTGVELYKQGLAPRLIFSGGRVSERVTEPQVMRRIAREHGVPESVVTLDDAGVTTDATVRNTAPMLRPGETVLAVSHGWHLPRVKLRYQAAGVTAYTVPANERGQMLRKTPYLVAREVPALWLYYLRAVVGTPG